MLGVTIGFALLVLWFSRARAVKCYQCESTGPNCTNGTCEGSRCFSTTTKLVTSSSEQTTIQKGCFSSSSSAQDQCSLVIDLDTVTSRSCICSFDYCNANSGNDSVVANGVKCLKGMRPNPSDTCTGEACFFSGTSVGCIGSAEIIDFETFLQPFTLKVSMCSTSNGHEQCICFTDNCNQNKPVSKYEDSSMINCQQCAGKASPCQTCSGNMCRFVAYASRPDKSERSCVVTSGPKLSSCKMMQLPNDNVTTCTCMDAMCNVDTSPQTRFLDQKARDEEVASNAGATNSQPEANETGKRGDDNGSIRHTASNATASEMKLNDANDECSSGNSTATANSRKTQSDTRSNNTEQANDQAKEANRDVNKSMTTRSLDHAAESKPGTTVARKQDNAVGESTEKPAAAAESSRSGSAQTIQPQHRSTESSSTDSAKSGSDVKSVKSSETGTAPPQTKSPSNPIQQPQNDAGRTEVTTQGTEPTGNVKDSNTKGASNSSRNETTAGSKTVVISGSGGGKRLTEVKTKATLSGEGKIRVVKETLDIPTSDGKSIPVTIEIEIET